MTDDDDEELLRSVALSNASAVQSARRRAERDLIEAREALVAREEQLQRITDATPALIAHVGPDERYTFVNRHFARFFRRTPAEIVGSQLGALSGRDVIDRIRHQIDRVRTGESVRFETYVTGPDGDQRCFALAYTPDLSPEGEYRGFFVTGLDVTELELLNETLREVASEIDVDRVLQTVTDATTRLTGAKFGAFFYNAVDERGEIYQLFALSGAAREDFEKFGMPRHTPLFGPTFRGEAVVRCDDVRLDPRYGHFPPHHGMPPGHLPVRSYLAVPVVSASGTVLGGLFFAHPEVGVFTERAERLVCSVAAQAAAALDKSRLFEAAQRAAEERRQLLESERAARAEAVRTSRLKDAFLATVSHELRTPLTSILGWAHVLLRRVPAEAAELRHGLEAIERNARAQARLIEDLLDTGRIESGKVRLDVQPVDPAAFVEAALHAHRPAADAKGLRLDQVFEADLGAIYGDPNRLQQIVGNLLSNAIKFTPPGGRIEVRLRQRPGRIEIAVQDTGIGIRAEFLPHLFERFRQADAETTRRHGGLGLGLSIVKQLVELHGGSVDATSDGEGAGSTFRVTLPLAASTDRAGSGVPGTAVPAIALSGLTVLVVDDEPDAREIVCRLLSDAGARVVEAASAPEALARLGADRPDVLVSDIGMPDVDGYELLRQVRALGPTGSLPAIALTALAQPSDRVRALQAGYQVHIAKPVEPAALLGAVAGAAGRR